MRAIDADALIEKAWDADTRVGYVQVVDVGDIKDAPTVKPEQKRGKWIDGSILTYSACSVCGYQERYAYEYNYCPNCGADMRGEQDDNRRL